MYAILLIFVMILLYINFKDYIFMKKIKSSITDESYYIRDEGDLQKKADMLAIIDQKADKLYNIVIKTYPNHPGILRLKKRYSSTMQEISPGSVGELAYNVNKGKAIALCLDQSDSINTAFYITIHEMAHTMTKEYKHNEEFWNNMQLLIDIAMANNLYKYENYKKTNTKFCKVDLNDDPKMLGNSNE